MLTEFRIGSEISGDHKVPIWRLRVSPFGIKCLFSFPVDFSTFMSLFQMLMSLFIRLLGRLRVVQGLLTARQVVLVEQKAE